jgi:hypothetical protein
LRDRPDLVLQQTPALPSPFASDFSAALSAKLAIADAICCFDDPGMDVAAKKVKTATLQELAMFVQLVESVPVGELDRIYDWVERTVFRTVTPMSEVFLRVNDFVVPPDPGWAHTSFAYEILRALVSRPLKVSFGIDFVKRLIGRLEVPDPNERVALGQVIVTMCEVSPELCDPTLRLMLAETHRYLDDLGSPLRIRPVLTVVLHCLRTIRPVASGSIYMQYLLPLTLLPAYHIYRQEFLLIAQWTMAELPGTVRATVHTVLRRFSITHPKNAAAQMELLTSAVVKLNRPQLKKICHRLIMLTVDCMSGCSLRLTQAAHELWITDVVQRLLVDRARVIVPLAVPALLKASRDSWANNQKTILRDSLNLLSRLDSEGFAQSNASAGTIDTRTTLTIWAGIIRAASRVDRFVNIADKLSETHAMLARATDNSMACCL